MTKRFLWQSLLVSLISLSTFSLGCAVAAKNTADEKSGGKPMAGEKRSSAVTSEIKTSVAKNSIEFKADSPAETIRVYFQNLREEKFREALMMTNMRVTVEGLSEAEAQDLKKDFAVLATQIPAELQISGEIITGDKATVTIKLPNEETKVLEDKVFNLQRQNNQWVYLMADPETEAAAKKEGKNYFFKMRLEVHHSEAQSMLTRIAKAEMVYAVQNGGLYADLPTLIAQGLLPEDAQNSDSTGYRYGITLSSDKKKYTATAEPAVYGKTGNLSFLLQIDEKGKNSGIKSKDTKGMPLKN